MKSFAPTPSDEPPRGTSKFRKVYGRGFFDGQQRMIETMNNSIFLAKERGLTSIARKVFDATPVDEAWDIAKIVSELRRTGCQAEHRIVYGCLASLKADGLVRELPNRVFMRVAKRPRLVEAEPYAPHPAAPAPTAQAAEPVSTEPAPAVSRAPTDENDPLKRMTAVADSLRTLASQIEDVALDFEAKLDAVKADSAKLRQLQELLKSIA